MIKRSEVYLGGGPVESLVPTAAELATPSAWCTVEILETDDGQTARVFRPASVNMEVAGVCTCV
jgi:hypothetical protein